MSIGELAAAAGVNVETIRYYQRRGLLSTPSRPMGGQRRYSRLALERLIFIRNAQKLAFSLTEVERLLALPDDESCQALQRIAGEKLVYLAERIDQIERVQRRLRALVKRCASDRSGPAFAIIQSLPDPASHE